MQHNSTIMTHYKTSGNHLTFGSFLIRLIILYDLCIKSPTAGSSQFLDKALSTFFDYRLPEALSLIIPRRFDYFRAFYFSRNPTNVERVSFHDITLSKLANVRQSSKSKYME